MRDGKPAILIECKSAGSKLSLNHASQLFRYFTTTDARFAVLTDGIEYQFYTDIEAPNKMDSHPFFEFSMLSLDAKIVEEIKKFSKQSFDLNNILCNASELKYKKQIRGLLADEMNSPSEEFVRLFTKQVYNGSITTNVKQQFTQLVGDAFRDFIKEMVQQRIQTALDGVSPVASSITSDSRNDNCQENEEEIVTTEEEIEGYHIIRAILSKHVNPQRIVIRDTKSYCGILLDDNNRKPVCRLRFNYSQKYIGLFDSQRNEKKIPIEAPTDLFKYESRLVDTIIYYTSQQQRAKSVDLSPQNGDSLESLPKTELSEI